MNRLTIFFLFSVSLFISHEGLAQINSHQKENWNFVKSEDNITVYTRKSSNSNLKEIKMSIDFEMNIDTFLTVLNDANTYDDWVYKCDKSKIISQPNNDEFYYHLTTDLPFPVTDRDLVVHCKQWIDEEGTIHSQSSAKPDFIDQKDGFIRIKMYRSKWEITPRSDGTIHIDYESLSDPGGSIPIWFVNMAIVSGPLNTMKQLKKLIVESATVKK